MDEEIAVVLQHPFAVLIAFGRNRQLASLLFHLQVDFIADSLRLPGIAAGADQEKIGKAGYVAQI